MARSAGSPVPWSPTSPLYPYGAQAGQRAEAGFRLMDYNARYYDPYLNRFISADTVVPNPGDPQDLNRYAYAGNNPVRYTDPTGHYLFEEEPDDLFIWRQDKPGDTNTLIRSAEPVVFWEETQQIKIAEPSGEFLRNMLFGSVPTVLGAKIEIGGGGDVVIGSDVSGGASLLYNWWSGQLTLMGDFLMGGSAGTPRVGGGSISINRMRGYGATDNSMFTGPANVVYGGVSADAWGNVGVVGSHSAAVEKHIGPYGEMPNDVRQWIVPAIDPVSGMQPTMDSEGVAIGFNMVPNGIDARIGWSPGTNYSLPLLEVNLYDLVLGR
jgi:RHS repeat-associated protein